MTGGLTLSSIVSSADKPTATVAATEELTSDQLLGGILGSLEDEKADDVVPLDLRGRSAMADHMVVASGRSSRQVAAIAEKLVERLKEQTGRTARVEGKETGDWVLIDTDDVIVHGLRPEVREVYQLEKMWMPADTLRSHTLDRVRAEHSADTLHI